MSATPRITLRHLRGACKEQRDIFKREWPNGAPVTLATARKAARLFLDVEWLALGLWDSNYHGVLTCRYRTAFYQAAGAACSTPSGGDSRYLEYKMAVAEAFVRIYREQLKSGVRHV